MTLKHNKFQEYLLAVEKTTQVRACDGPYCLVTSGAPNEIIVQNLLNIALLNVF